MKDFENDLIYYPNPDPVKEPRFILKIQVASRSRDAMCS